MPGSFAQFALTALAAALVAGCVSVAPTVQIIEAPGIKFPAKTDCNSPAHWDGDTLYLFNSAGKLPQRSCGPDLLHLGSSTPAEYDNAVNGGRWIEATWRDDDGTLYGWYHNEPFPVCERKTLTAPRIGAVKSRDNGANWTDLGFILEAPPGSLRPDTRNHYFAGGNGDFSVMLDEKRGYFYFFISTYHKETFEQGVSVARMRFEDRDAPVGTVRKWRDGKWGSPGIHGHVTPLFPAKKDWHDSREVDVFWGPSIHWNTHLGTYVILLNRCCESGHEWKQEGIYVTYNRDLADPNGWTPPKKILDKGSWYPQVIGLSRSERETDKLAGRSARFFMHGESRWLIRFLRPGESP